MMRCLYIFSGIALLLGGFGTSWAQNDVDSLLAVGDQLSQKGDFKSAYKSYEKANKVSGEKCAFCLLKMAMVKVTIGEEGPALKLAEQSLTVSTNSHERADAYGVKGEILSSFAEDKEKKLAAAADAIGSAIKEDPKATIFHMKLGRILLREGKTDEGKSELQAYLASNPKDAELVKRWLQFPDKAKYAASPEFVLATSSGGEITPTKLAGKVVLLDFWATWCPPCRASVPEIKELTQKYPADRLQVISVSSDNDQNQWKKFIADKQMTWPQYIDYDHHMTKLFGVHSFPTYIIIDGDGFVRERITSYDPQQSLASRLKAPLKKMLE